MKKDKIKMLLVEDNTAHVDLIMRGLEGTLQRFEVMKAFSLHEAREYLSKSKPDIVIADYLLPDGKGDELVSLSNQVFPLIIITSHGSPKIAVEILKAGAMDYIVKSTETFLDMYHIVDRVLREWQNIHDKKRAEEEKKILEEKLLRAERMESLGILAGGIAHDLNNILGPMLMLPEIIKDDIRFLARQISIENSEMKALVSNIEKDISLIENHTKRAVKVIKDLLAMSRRGRYEFEPVSINLLISATLKDPEFIALRRDKPQVIVETKLESNLPFISASHAHLHRVLYNLYINSFDSIENHGKIIIHTKQVFLDKTYLAYEPISAGDYVVVEVIDTGSGIKTEYISRMFEPFFSTKKQSRKSGSGLGLSVVHGIVKDHNGFIDVTSKVGEGTCFKLYFPSLEPKIEENPLESTKRMVRGGAERILIVDDEPGQIFIAKRALSKYGYRLEEAKSGEEALQKIQENRLDSSKNPKSLYSLIIMDIRMEKMDGMDLYARIQECIPGMKVLIVSAHVSPEMIRFFFEKGVFWLAKPYTKETIALSVRRSIDGEIP